MAKALLERALSEAGREATVLARALISAADEVASEAVSVMHAEGLDIEDHIPTLIAEHELDRADLVLVMDRELLSSAHAKWPAHSAKVHLIREFASGEREDVEDPLDGHPSSYKTAAVLLRRAAKAIAAGLSTTD